MKSKRAIKHTYWWYIPVRLNRLYFGPTPSLWKPSLYLCRSKELIIKAIQDNDFLRNLERVQVNEIMDCMYQREFTKEQYICREGSVGTQLYVISGVWGQTCFGVPSMLGTRLFKNGIGCKGTSFTKKDLGSVFFNWFKSPI